MWGGGLPQDLGRRIRRTTPPVLRVEAFGNRVAEVVRPFLRDLGEVPHTLAVALGAAMARLVRSSQIVREGHPHVEPIVEGQRPWQHRLLEAW